MLIAFVRANPVWRPGYWEAIAAKLTRGSAANVREHWAKLRGRRPELPAVQHMLSIGLTDEQARNLIRTRNSDAVRGDSRRSRKLRALRCEWKRRGIIDLPSWYWTASEDKALIDYVRANPVYRRGYWTDIAARIGRCKAKTVRARWHDLQVRGVPLPPLTYPGAGCLPRPVWPPERVAETLKLLRTKTRAEVCEQLGVTHGSLCHMLRKYGHVRTRPSGLRPSRGRNAADEADAAFMEKALRDYERNNQGEMRHAA